MISLHVSIRLKKKPAIVLTTFLVLVGFWATIYLNSPPATILMYQQFLIIASVFFIMSLVFGFAVILSSKRQWKPVRKYETTTSARWGGVGGGAETKTTEFVPVERPPHYKSKRFVKWSLIIGGVLALFGFSYGIVWPAFGYACVLFGGAPLGWGLALVITRGRY